MNILIVRFSSLGDLVTLEPVFRAIRYFFKDANIYLLTTNVGKSLYEDSDYFDEFVIHKSIFKSIKSLKAISFDLVFNLQCNKPSHYVTLFVKKKKLINISHSIYHKLLGIKAKAKNPKEMLSMTNLCDTNKLNSYFNEKKSRYISLPYRKKDFFDKTDGYKYIAISTGTSERWVSKKWGIYKYYRLIEKILAKNYKVILIGGALELKDEKYILKSYPNIKSFVNKTNLSDLKSLLASVDLFIGNDSGPAHIAAGVETNTITIFGSTNPNHSPKFMPYNGFHEFLKPSSEIKCHPCYKTVCPTNNECMDSIKVEQVLDKIDFLLKDKE